MTGGGGADGGSPRLHREQYGAVLKAHPVTPERVPCLSKPLPPLQPPLNRRESWLRPGEPL